jgi:HTH-type transcriptional regulator/antitoxin HigA
VNVKKFDPVSAERAWKAFRSSTGIAAIQTPRQYEQTVAFMNQLLDLVGENERHSLVGLLDLVGELVAAYESRMHPVVGLARHAKQPKAFAARLPRVDHARAGRYKRQGRV